MLLICLDFSMHLYKLFFISVSYCSVRPLQNIHGKMELKMSLFWCKRIVEIYGCSFFTECTFHRHKLYSFFTLIFLILDVSTVNLLGLNCCSFAVVWISVFFFFLLFGLFLKDCQYLLFSVMLYKILSHASVIYSSIFLGFYF